MTQIQLEHIRKLSFIPDKSSSLLLDPHEGKTEDAEAEQEAKKTDDKAHIQFKKYASGFWSVQSTHDR